MALPDSPPPASTTVRPDGGTDAHPGWAEAVGRRLGRYERSVWTLALLLLVIDIATTIYGLKLGLGEANPVAAVLLDRYGLVALGALKGAALAVAAIGWVVVTRPYRGIVPVCLTIPWAVGTVSNALLILRVVGP